MNDAFINSTLTEILACLKENKCFHGEAAEGARWLNLRGIKRKSEYKQACFLKEIMCLRRFAIDKLNTHIERVEMPKVDFLSYSFYNSDRISSVNENSIRTFCKEYYDKWLKIEKENAEFYKDTWAALISHSTVNSIALADYVKCLLKCSQKKIKYITRIILENSAHNWNILMIMKEQECMHDHYREKMSKAMKIEEI